MRTVTFSTPEIQLVLNREFVSLYTNTTGDPTAGQSIRHAPSDPPGMCIRGNGEQNVQVIVMTPDLKIIHTVCGYIDAEQLFDELRFAHDLFQSIKGESADAAERVRDSHRQRLVSAGFPESQIDASNDVELMQSVFSESGNGNKGGFGGPESAFDAFTRQQILRDGRFCMRNPLISMQQLESDPGELVGRGQTFFSSSSSGNSPDMGSFRNFGMPGQFPVPGQFRQR